MICITGARSAYAEKEIVQVLNESVRFDYSSKYLYLTVCGKSEDGEIIYLEKLLNTNKYYWEPQFFWADYKNRYTRYSFYIVYKNKGKEYILGEINQFEYHYAFKGPYTNAELYVPWIFRTDKQEFEMDFKTEELEDLPEYDYDKTKKLKDLTIDKVKFEALQGNLEAIERVKENNL